ncbi:MAG: hypothetical protein ACTSX8_02760 [Alphaproteobacteria bacterium]
MPQLREGFEVMFGDAYPRETCTYALLDPTKGGIEMKRTALLSDSEFYTVLTQLRESPGAGGGHWVSEVAGSIAHMTFDCDEPDPRDARARSEYPLQQPNGSGPSSLLIKTAVGALEAVVRAVDDGDSVVPHTANVGAGARVQIVAVVTRKIRATEGAGFEHFPGKWHLYLTNYFIPSFMRPMVYNQLLEQEIKSPEVRAALTEMLDSGHSTSSYTTLCVPGSSKDEFLTHHVPTEIWVREGFRYHKINVLRRPAAPGYCTFILGDGFVDERHDPRGILGQIGLASRGLADDDDDGTYAQMGVMCGCMPRDGESCGDAGCPYHGAPPNSLPLLEFARPRAAREGWTMERVERAIWNLFRLRPSGRLDAYAIVRAEPRLSLDLQRQYSRVFNLPKPAPAPARAAASGAAAPTTTVDIFELNLKWFISRSISTLWVEVDEVFGERRCRLSTSGHCTLRMTFAPNCFSGCPMHGGVPDHDISVVATFYSSKVKFQVEISCQTGEGAAAAAAAAAPEKRNIAARIADRLPTRAFHAHILAADKEFQEAWTAFRAQWTTKNYGTEGVLRTALLRLAFPHSPRDWPELISRNPVLFSKCPLALIRDAVATLPVAKQSEIAAQLDIQLSSDADQDQDE